MIHGRRWRQGRVAFELQRRVHRTISILLFSVSWAVIIASPGGRAENLRHDEHAEPGGNLASADRGSSTESLLSTRENGEEDDEDEQACMVIASPGEDVEGQHAIWWLESGVPGHWSSGTSIPVFEGDTANIVVMASNCRVHLPPSPHDH